MLKIKAIRRLDIIYLCFLFIIYMFCSVQRMKNLFFFLYNHRKQSSIFCLGWQENQWKRHFLHYLMQNKNIKLQPFKNAKINQRLCYIFISFWKKQVWRERKFVCDDPTSKYLDHNHCSIRKTSQHSFVSR
jgi:hypothetical protein